MELFEQCRESLHDRLTQLQYLIDLHEKMHTVMTLACYYKSFIDDSVVRSLCIFACLLVPCSMITLIRLGYFWDLYNGSLYLLLILKLKTLV